MDGFLHRQRRDSVDGRRDSGSYGGDGDGERSSSQDWEEGPQSHGDADTRSQCSQRSDLGYHSGGAMSDGGGTNRAYEQMSSMRSVGSAGSHGSGERGFSGGSHHSLTHRPFPMPPGAAHLMNGETQFPPSLYHAASDAAKSDAATVCSGSVVEDIEEESIVSQEGGGSLSATSHPSPPSSVKMAFGGGLRRSNSTGNRLVDFADRSQEAHAAVIPQQRGPSSHNSHLPQEDDADMTSMHYNDMGPPLSRTLLLQGGSSSRAGSVKSLESNAGSDVVAHVDTDDCGGSLVESITDAHSVHSQDDAPHDSCIQELNDAAAAAKPVGLANPPSDSAAQSPHPLLCSDGQSLNGRTSPGGTIYKGRGVRRYQGRYMHLPLKRFHQNGVHLNSVDEPVHNSDQPMFDHYPPVHHDNGDPPPPPHWEGNRYDSGGDAWERDSGGDRMRERDNHSPPRGGGGGRRSSYARKRSRSRSRSRSPDSGNDEKQSSSRYTSDRDSRKNRARRSNNSYHNGYNNGYHNHEESQSSSRHRGYRSRGGRGSRNGSSKDSPSTRNGTRSKYRRR